MMNNINGNDYRHPKFLQSLNLTLNELKIVNLFLKRINFRTDANQKQMQKTPLVSARNILIPSKIPATERVSIDV